MRFRASQRSGEEVRAARRRSALAPRPVLESLEGRQLLAWSPLWKSLPDLTVSGIAAPVAAFGAPVAFTADVSNLGSSTIPQFDQSSTAISTATATDAQLIVYASRSPRYNIRQLVEVGRFDLDDIPQNSVQSFTGTVTLPNDSPRLPAAGNPVYLYFRVATPLRPNPDFDPTNNVTRTGVPVQTTLPLPDLFGYSLDVPSRMQPGDAIRPTIQIVNYGAVDPAAQGPFEVYLVASEDLTFGPGDIVLAASTVTSVPPLALVPMTRPILGDLNIDTPLNVVTLASTSAITLPATASQYYLGVVVDPTNAIIEISEIGTDATAVLNPVVVVGPRQHAFPPADQVAPPAPPENVFPIPPGGPIPLDTSGPGGEPVVSFTTTTGFTPNSTTTILGHAASPVGSLDTSTNLRGIAVPVVTSQGDLDSLLAQLAAGRRNTPFRRVPRTV